MGKISYKIIVLVALVSILVTAYLPNVAALPAIGFNVSGKVHYIV